MRERGFLLLAALAAVEFLFLSSGLIYPDPILNYPFPGGDTQDWIANGLFYIGQDVRYSARPPLLPLVLAGLHQAGVMERESRHDERKQPFDRGSSRAAGGQGALVCRDGVEIMPPTWRPAGVINEALRLIGMKRSLTSDHFDAAGLGAVRSNDDLLNLIQTGL